MSNPPIHIHKFFHLILNNKISIPLIIKPQDQLQTPLGYSRQLLQQKTGTNTDFPNAQSIP